MTATTFPISGYASVFNVVDHHGEMMLHGAYKESLKNASQRIAKRPLPLLWHHDPKKPIGIITNLREDPHGLYIEGQIYQGSLQAEKCIHFLKTGLVSGLSVGYKLHQSKKNRGITLITKVELFEVSLVTFPACDDARVMNL